MKILFVTPYLAEAYGGTSHVVQALAKSLGQLGVLVDVVTTNANDRHPPTVSNDHWIHHSHYRVRYFSSWYRSDLIFSPPLLRWLTQCISHYDIVHTHTLFSPLISLTNTLCQLHQRPYLITPHGMLDEWALAYKNWKKQRYYNWIERHLLQHSHAVHVISTTEQSQVNHLGYSQTLLVPNGIQSYPFHPLPDANLFYQDFPELRTKTLILFLGRIDPKKGIDLLAPAFAKVQMAFPNTHLILAGPDSIHFTPTAQGYFANVNCLDAVTFTGMLSGDRKYAALAAADLYVSPSYSEGFSISILEGMAAGLPCVITTGCNFPEAATHQAAHVVEVEAKTIADAMITCLSNQKSAKAMGDRARQLIFNHYTWEKAANTLIHHYQNILNAPS